ncbi:MULTISPECIES: 2-hydroxyacid dehydrogenase [unclassified Sinorhizobium]|uniref:2-hydroxyacid dehydrogenase n=1 Tax=unclassified Sinorhizobium TaxID=2613772 RepID=UPI0024C285F9|nr:MULTISPECIES: 2-hydroxyacid dehydrogenase [unclassified Sinorhizobium]MDK1377339.1 2-hydroxyacid dehydrogenase [Sinorhizobium sp. 6-70]MDK1480349.1 2-hydroxyacid dehydrogenase [Sinorhizobium sp. 6-117]
MKPDLLLVEPMMPLVMEELHRDYTVHRLYEAADRPALEAALPSIRAVATGGGTGLSNDWIEKLPSLGIIAINGVGTDKVDLAHARGRNIDVTTTPGVLTDDVADLGIALMLAVLRRLGEGDRLVREGRWAAGEQLPLGHSPKGKRIGVLGLGQIGRALALRAEAFGMSVRYWNRSRLTDVTWVAHESPADLARDSDVLAVCVAASAATQNIVDTAVLEALGPKGIVVNVARGSVVDEDALIEALRSGTIAGAGLDVFVNEPKIRSEFHSTPNTVLMPHQGSATVETRLAMGRLVLANLAAHFAGQKSPNVAN